MNRFSKVVPFVALGLGTSMSQAQPDHPAVQSKVVNAHREWVASLGKFPSKQSLSLKGGHFEYHVKVEKPPDAKALPGTRASGDYGLSGIFRVINANPNPGGKPLLGLDLRVDLSSARKAGVGEDEIARNMRDFGCANRVQFFVLDDPCPMLFDGFTALVPKELAVKLAPKVKAFFTKNADVPSTP